MPIVSLAIEYREVQASEILEQIENGEDVNLTDCRIIGELNLNKIQLETVPNPRYNELFGYFGHEVTKDLKVVKNNITIHNSIFESDIDFSNTLFEKPFYFAKVTSFSSNFISTTFGDDANFDKASFGDGTNFEGASFGDFTWFADASFGNDANFALSSFGYDAIFLNASFGDNAHFRRVIFGGDTDFEDVSFGNDADFWYASFGNDAYFDCSSFGDEANFEEASFGDTVYFSDAKFKNVSLNGTDFKEMKVNWDSLENSLVFDRLTYVKLVRNFRNIEQFEDADDVYFLYRKHCQAENPWISLHEESPWISFPKVGDIFMWLSCGYGVKPSYTVGSSIFVILLFSIIYLLEDACSIGLKKCFGRRFSELSGIISRFRISKGENILNFSSTVFYLKGLFHWRGWDAFYFSIASFTNSNYEDWKPQKYSRKISVFEGFIGNLFIALFIVTMVNVLLRP